MGLLLSINLFFSLLSLSLYFQFRLYLFAFIGVTPNFCCYRCPLTNGSYGGAGLVGEAEVVRTYTPALVCGDADTGLQTSTNRSSR